MYQVGTGVPEDDAEGARLIRLAAEGGLAWAQYQLGQMYRVGGDGVPEDDAEAVRWYTMAAEQGLFQAQYWLASMYQLGTGVPENLVVAYMWYNLAAAQGLEQAQGPKRFVEQQMTREQIAEAQRLSREWFETHPQDGP